MTWEELKQKAKEMGYKHTESVFGEILKKGNVFFVNYGTFVANEYVVSERRTPEQMLAIMKALQ